MRSDRVTAKLECPVLANLKCSASYTVTSLIALVETDMDKPGTNTMAMRELDRLKIIEAVIDGTLKPGRAAERLGLLAAKFGD